MNKGLKIGLIAGGSVLVIGAVALFAWIKFGRTDAHLRLIPKEATSVAIINVRSLFTKAAPEELMKLPFFQQQQKRGGIPPELKLLLDDPLDLGADITQNIAAFVNTSDGATTAGLVFKINNGGLFASKFAKISGYSRPNKVSGFWYIPIEANVGICWNDDAGILFAGDPDAGESNQAQAERLLRQPEEASILDNPNYSAFAKQTFDIGLMVDNSVVNRSVDQNEWGEIYNLFGAANGWSDVLLNFEDGTVDIAYATHQPDKQTATLRDKGPDPTHFETVADKEPIAFLCFALDLQQLLAQLRRDPKMQRNFDELKDELGISVDDLARSFTGDVSLALTDYRDIVKTDPILQQQFESIREQSAVLYDMLARSGRSGMQQPTQGIELLRPVFILNMSVRDTATPGRMLRLMGLRMGNDGFYVAPASTDMNLYVALRGSHMVLTNGYEVAAQVARTGKLSGRLPGDIDLAKSSSGRLELNPDKYPQALLTELGSTMGPGFPMFLKAMKPLHHVSLEGKENGGMLKIHLTPGEGNSLFRLIAHEAETLGNF